MPEWAADIPDLNQAESYYLDAFSDLSTDRNYESGPIPYSAISRYIVEKEFSPMVAHVFNRIIRALDSAYLKWLNSRQKIELDAK